MKLLVAESWLCVDRHCRHSYELPRSLVCCKQDRGSPGAARISPLQLALVWQGSDQSALNSWTSPDVHNKDTGACNARGLLQLFD